MKVSRGRKRSNNTDVHDETSILAVPRSLHEVLSQFAGESNQVVVASLLCRGPSASTAFNNIKADEDVPWL